MKRILKAIVAVVLVVVGLSVLSILAYIVYDASGHRVDRTLDEGDDSRFQRKWGKSKWR